ncbi:MAG: IclR family transcriptional regulator [Chloroflexi bacterium]|nr:IclR family transcriptional regulator [Chloroflexota bacterium]
MRNQPKYLKRDTSHYVVQAVDRAVAILDSFSSGDEELGITELSDRVGLHPATVHRLLCTLEHRRLIEQDQKSSKYRLGFKLFELGSLVSNALDVRKMAHPYLLELVERGGETAHLMVLEGRDIVFVDKVESANPFRMVSQIGKRLPAHCSGAGKCLLARLPDRDLEAILAGAPLPNLTPKSITELGGLRQHLSQVRLQGFAVDDEETQAGLRCIGAPIFDHSGKAVAAISISGPVARVSKKQIPFFVQLVRGTAQDISRSLGHRG